MPMTHLIDTYLRSHVSVTFNPLTAVLTSGLVMSFMCTWCAVMMSVTRHVQHNFCAFRGTAGTDYWLWYWHLEIWDAAQDVVYNHKGVWQLRG